MSCLFKKIVCSVVFTGLIFSVSTVDAYYPRYNHDYRDRSHEEEYKNSDIYKIKVICGCVVGVCYVAALFYSIYKQSKLEEERLKGESHTNHGTNATQKDNKNSPKVTFKDIVGMDEAVQEAQESVDFLLNPKKYKEMGARAPRGLLVFGPPGTGKTLLARAIAGEAGCTFIQISGAEFVEKYVGVGPARVRELFSEAKKKAPAIIFIDEIDSLGKRGGDSSGGTSEYNNTINEILKQMDGFDQSCGILVVGATNYPDRLDSALLRPKRFDRKVQIVLPGKKGRKDLFVYYCKKVTVGDDFNLNKEACDLAEQTEGFSPAEIENVANEAAILAVRHKSKAVEKEHFEQALKKVKKSKI